MKCQRRSLLYNRIRIMKMKELIAFALIVLQSTAEPSFGPNLLRNSYFAEPAIPSNLIFKYFQFSIPGWSCSKNCEVDNCALIRPLWLRHYGINFGDCFHQVIDLCSDSIETLTQIFQGTDDPHLLNLTFLYPMYGANNKTLVVYLNNQIVLSFIPSSYDLRNHSLKLYVYPRVGVNNLSLTMSGRNDTQGYRIIAVELYREINERIKSMIQAFTSNFIASSAVELSGSRVFLGELVNSFVSFDRMQFYFYHNRNFSDYSQIFLRQISSLMDSKGNIALGLQQKVMGKAGSAEEGFLSSHEYKGEYINVAGLNKTTDGFGFMANNSTYLCYSVPLIVCILSFFYCLFRLTFHLKVSKLFRKYSFLGLLVLAICEGNVEQFAYYSFGELTTLFSACPSHKVVNLVILSFFYFIVLCSVSMYIFFKMAYRSKLCYLVDNSRTDWLAIFGNTVDHGVVCLLFACCHQLLLRCPDWQIFALMLVDGAWIAVQVGRIVLDAYEWKLLVWINVVEGTLRILFQLSLYCFTRYSSRGELKYVIGDLFQLTLIFLFIAVWALQFATNFIVVVAEAVCFLRRQRAREKRTERARQVAAGNALFSPQGNHRLIHCQLLKISKFFREGRPKAKHPA